jgi:hypothetical protein
VTVVRFRTRIRLTVMDGEPCDGLIASALEAVDAAMTRSVGRAATMHLIRDARADPAMGPRIDVTLSGAPLPADAGKTLREGLAALAQRKAGALLDRANDSRPVGKRMLGANESTAEAFDDYRWVPDDKDAATDSYLVPSYDDRGQPVALPVRGGGSAPKGLAQQHWKLRAIGSDRELAEAIAAQYHGRPPELFVAVFSQDGRPMGWLCRTDTATGELLELHRLGIWTIFEPQGGTDKVNQGDFNVSQGDRLVFIRDATTNDQVNAMHVEMLKRYLQGQPGGHSAAPLAIESQAKKLAKRLVVPRLPVRYYDLMSGAELRKTVELSLADTGLTGLPAADLPVCIFGDHVAASKPEETQPQAVLPLEELGPFFEPDPDKPFLSEPPVDFWPPDTSALFRDLIADLASRLDMRLSLYPGMFSLAACDRIRVLAVSYGHLAGDGQSEASPRSLKLANLAGAIESVEKLANLYTTLIGGGANLPPRLRGNSGSWLLHFREKYYDILYAAIGSLFVGACQDILLENLEKSRYELQRRKANFAAYMTVTRSLILSMLVDLPELAALREVLVERERGAVLAIAASVVAPPIAPVAASLQIEAWSTATKAVLTAFGDVDASVAPQPGVMPTRMTKGGSVQVQDATGRWWSRAELDGALSANRQQAFAVDPLLEKLSHLDDVVTRLRAAGAAGVDDEFRRLIDELLDTNAEKTSDARSDPDIAFGLAKFGEADFRDTEYGATLTGIFQLADAFLKPLFPGELVHTYISGVSYLASVEIGKEKFSEFFNLVGLVAIAMFCPELAFVIGAVEAVQAVAVAEEHVEIQHALLGGDEIISKADAEAELWGAAIGAALAFIPEVGRVAVGAGRAIAKRELRAVASNVGRRFATDLATRIAEAAAEGIAQKFVAECLKAYVLNLAISAGIRRFTAAVELEVKATGSAGITDIPQLVGDTFAKALGNGS